METIEANELPVNLTKETPSVERSKTLEIANAGAAIESHHQSGGTEKVDKSEILVPNLDKSLPSNNVGSAAWNEAIEEKGEADEANSYASSSNSSGNDIISLSDFRKSYTLEANNRQKRIRETKDNDMATNYPSRIQEFGDDRRNSTLKSVPLSKSLKSSTLLNHPVARHVSGSSNPSFRRPQSSWMQRSSSAAKWCVEPAQYGQEAAAHDVDYFAERPSLMARCTSTATLRNPIYKYWCSPSPLQHIKRRMRERRARRHRPPQSFLNSDRHNQNQMLLNNNNKVAAVGQHQRRQQQQQQRAIKMPTRQRISMSLSYVKSAAFGNQAPTNSLYSNHTRFHPTATFTSTIVSPSNKAAQLGTTTGGGGLSQCSVRMVAVAGYVRVSPHTPQPLADLTADVVNCFAVGEAAASGGGDSLVVVLANNILRVYSKLESHYIPTVEAFLPFSEDSVPTCFNYNSKTRTGVIGSSRGIIVIFEIDPSLNSLVKMVNSEKYFADSIKRIAYLPTSEIIIATNGYHMYVYDANSLVVRNQLPSKSPVKATYTCIEVSPDEDTIFMGTASGTIEILDHNKGNCIFKSMLKGHDYEITAIHFLKEKSMLFTGDNYGFIQMWYLQAGQHMVNLFHHQSAILALNTYTSEDKFHLASICKQNLLVHWDLLRERHSPVTWNKSQECETCTKPFFFNFKKLWSLKQVIGERRHHCRSCGKSICSNCCAKMDRLPNFGLEIQSNSCYDCRANYSENDLQSSIIAIQGEESKIRRAAFSKYLSTESGRMTNAYCIVSGSFYQSIKLNNLYHEF